MCWDYIHICISAIVYNTNLYITYACELVSYNIYVILTQVLYKKMRVELFRGTKSREVRMRKRGKEDWKREEGKNIHAEQDQSGQCFTKIIPIALSHVMCSESLFVWNLKFLRTCEGLRVHIKGRIYPWSPCNPPPSKDGSNTYERLTPPNAFVGFPGRYSQYWARVPTDRSVKC